MHDIIEKTIKYKQEIFWNGLMMLKNEHYIWLTKTAEIISNVIYDKFFELLTEKKIHWKKTQQHRISDTLDDYKKKISILNTMCFNNSNKSIDEIEKLMMEKFYLNNTTKTQFMRNILIKSH